MDAPTDRGPRFIPLLLPTLAKVPSVLVFISESFVPSDEPVVCVSPVPTVSLLPSVSVTVSVKVLPLVFPSDTFSVVLEPLVIPVDFVLDSPRVSLSDELELLLSE